MTAKEHANNIRVELSKIANITGIANSAFDRVVSLVIEAAVLEERQRNCTFIEEQNAMVNTLWGEKTEPGRHDAFVRDIVRAIREGNPNG